MNLISAVIFFVVFLLDRHTAYLPFFSLCMAALGLAIGLMNGINIYMGKCVNKNVADSLALPYTPCDQAF